MPGCSRHQMLSCGQSWHGVGMLGMTPDTTTGGRIVIAAEPDTCLWARDGGICCGPLPANTSPSSKGYGPEFAGDKQQQVQNTRTEPIAFTPVTGRENICPIPCLYHLNITVSYAFRYPQFICMTCRQTSCLADPEYMPLLEPGVVPSYAYAYKMKSCQWPHSDHTSPPLTPTVILLLSLSEVYFFLAGIFLFFSYIPQSLTTYISRLTSESAAYRHTSTSCSICQT
ncbi:hypothetical protein QBC40DRAFT_303208 [Triangularia verruculosa]|uniref:Uncharacterized protein n=1 Tax=Triangularia verruculosa TaxID=2587418 RepID=A0AAN6XQV3_9PEZI|nr:hypothetical protein QBC40DRAFT_303208 [Triangularia verruculosa]